MKKQKWINTRFAKHYKRRLAWASIKAVMALHQGIFHLNQIRSTRTETPEQKINKKLAMASTSVTTMQAVTNIMQEAKK